MSRSARSNVDAGDAMDLCDRVGMQRTPTEQLLGSWRGGDAEALERLTVVHLPILLARAREHPLRRHLRSRPDPSDLVHDVFTRVLSSGLLERFEHRGPGSLRNVLYRVLDRTILDALRFERACKRSANVAPAPRDETSAGTAALARHMDDREPSPTSAARRNEWIASCRRILTDREWTVWSAVDIDERTPAEVARSLGDGESAVRGVLFRARARILRELFFEQE